MCSRQVVDGDRIGRLQGFRSDNPIAPLIDITGLGQYCRTERDGVRIVGV
jgi:hypothetical protein